MNIHQFISLIGKKKQTIVSLLVLFLAIAIIVSAVQPFRYGSSLNLLTIINFKESVDPYTASRSNEYISGLLSRIVSSGNFFAQIKSSDFNIDKSYFSGDEKKQMKKWNQTVKAKSIADTGMISIDVYHTDRAQAEEVAKAVAYTLQTTNSQYHGFGNTIEIKIIDQPITSHYPVRPNVPLNLGLGVVFAVIFFLCYIYLFPEERYDIRLWPKKNYGKISRAEVYTPAENEISAPAYDMVQEPVFAEATADEEEVAEENFQNNGSMDNVFKR